MSVIPFKHLVLGLFGIVFTVVLPLPALAIPAITCHCFTDRAYDPARPAAADAYFLATTQNSFFAEVFKENKGAIVMKKQKGVSSDDLWIAYWAASRSGGSADSLLQIRQAKESWKEVLASQKINDKVLGKRFSKALHANLPAARLAEAVVDEVLVNHRLSGDAELEALRKAGATNQEIILSLVLARRTGQPAPQLVLQVKKGSKTWGGLLREARIQGAEMQKEVALILSARP